MPPSPRPKKKKGAQRQRQKRNTVHRFEKMFCEKNILLFHPPLGSMHVIDELMNIDGIAKKKGAAGAPRIIKGGLVTKCKRVNGEAESASHGELCSLSVIDEIGSCG